MQSKNIQWILNKEISEAAAQKMHENSLEYKHISYERFKDSFMESSQLMPAALPTEVFFFS